MEKRSPFGRVVLVVGREGLLAERAVQDFVDQARREQPDAVVTSAAAGEVDAGSLAEMTGGSLFAAASTVVLGDISELAADLHPFLLDLAKKPSPELALVLTHPGGVKAKGLVDGLKKAGVEVVECSEVKPWELPQFVTGEARRLGVRIDAAAAAALVDAIGGDLRALAAGISQLRVDSPDGITPTVVARYFGGRADVTSFAVADEVMAGRSSGALEKLRWALSTGVSPVLVTSALANALRGLGKYLDAADGRMREAELAKLVGVPPWKLKDLGRQARDWTSQGVAQALKAVAVADGEIKGAASDPGFALEQAVLKVIALRGRRAATGRG